MERTRKHTLINIVFMTVCGVLSGANSISGIHEFAIDRWSWLAGYLDLSIGRLTTSWPSSRTSRLGKERSLANSPKESPSAAV